MLHRAQKAALGTVRRFERGLPTSGAGMGLQSPMRILRTPEQSSVDGVLEAAKVDALPMIPLKRCPVWTMMTSR